jgi:predicted nuclease of predicted toxin-antitoxin system
VSLAFYMDEQVPSAITSALRSRGVDVLTVQEDGFDGQPDSEVLDRAGLLGRVVVTMDNDFHILTSARLASGVPFSGVVFVHAGSLTVGQLVEDLELLAQLARPEEMADHLQYLPL